MEDIIKETKKLTFKTIEISQINRGLVRDSGELIGNTPLVRSNHMIDGLEAEVVAKLESFNP
jgi:cysteine synthase A